MISYGTFTDSASRFVNDLHPVLILAGTPRGVQSIARCLNRHRIAVDVGHSKSFTAAGFTSRSIRNICHLPEFSQTEGFRKAPLDLFNKHHYDMLVPTTDEALLAIAPFYREIRERLYLGSPPPQIVNSVLENYSPCKPQSSAELAFLVNTGCATSKISNASGTHFGLLD